MQLPITIGLHRSRLLGRALLFLATLGIVIFCTLPRSTALGMGFSLMLMLLSVRAWRAIDAGPVGITLAKDGGMALHFPGESAATVVHALEGALIHPWLTVVRLQEENHPQRIQTVVLLPDSLSTEDFRQLRVFLCWQPAVFRQPDGGA